MSQDELAEALSRIRELEHEISVLNRRQLHLIDEVHAERRTVLALLLSTGDSGIRITRMAMALAAGPLATWAIQQHEDIKSGDHVWTAARRR